MTPIVYTVVAGDSLFSIADQFKANLCTMMIINNITDPTLLTVGRSSSFLARTRASYGYALPTGLPRGTTLDYVVQCDRYAGFNRVQVRQQPPKISPRPITLRRTPRSKSGRC